MARAFGSYPKGQRFESVRRHHCYNKGPKKLNRCGRIAQLGEHLPYKQGVIGSSPVAPTSVLNLRRGAGDFLFSQNHVCNPLWRSLEKDADIFGCLRLFRFF